jgi:death-on-curing protein
LIALHAEVIKPEYGGGSPGIRSVGGLDAAAERPLTILFGEEQFPTHFDKAAALMDSIIRRHPFVDGNKRTAFAAAVVLIEIATGLAVQSPEEDEETITVAVATKQVDLAELAAWLEEHSVSR